MPDTAPPRIATRMVLNRLNHLSWAMAEAESGSGGAELTGERSSVVARDVQAVFYNNRPLEDQLSDGRSFAALTLCSRRAAVRSRSPGSRHRSIRPHRPRTRRGR